MDMFNGKRIIVSNSITKQVPCRTHKKRRINKKWLKKYGYKSVPNNEIAYMINDCIIMTQKCFDKISHLVEHYDEVAYDERRIY